MSDVLNYFLLDYLINKDTPRVEKIYEREGEKFKILNEALLRKVIEAWPKDRTRVWTFSNGTTSEGKKRNCYLYALPEGLVIIRTIEKDDEVEKMKWYFLTFPEFK